jgi:tRNA(fMet)-specific endonuclease VapC
VTLSIDTNVFVDLIRGRRSDVRERFRLALSEESLVASLIVFHELLYGAAIHARPDAQRENVRLVLGQVTIQPFDERDMAATAQLRARLKLRGAPIGSYDALVAGQALARGWTVVTGNVGEFSRIDGLNVIDWTVAAD